MCVWDDNIKQDFTEVGRVSVDWIQLALDSIQWRTLVNTVINLGFHKRWRIT
jgi:hypothetical protein